MELFNEVAECQRALGEEISRLVSNMKKDGPTRKDHAYIAKHESAFGERWEKFNARHKQLEAMNLPNQKYFVQKYYEQVEAQYNQALLLLAQYRENISTMDAERTLIPDRQQNMVSGDSHVGAASDSRYLAPATAGSSRKSVPSIGEPSTGFQEEGSLMEGQKIRLRKQNVRMENCRRVINDILKKKELQSKVYYELKIRELGDQWNNIQELHEEIMTYIQESDRNYHYFKDKEFEDLETLYQETIITLHEMKEEKRQCEKAGEIKLPQIQIPTFDGDYKNWTSFHDIYASVIHTNKGLTNAQKMQYLKTSLTGEAHKLIQHLISSDKNYSAAWELITNRFSNKRIIFSAHADTLLNLPALTTDSANAIKQLHDVTRECMYALSNLQLDTLSWSPFIAHITIKKMDKETHKLYEQSLKQPREIQELEDVLDFLETRFQSLEAIGEPTQRADATSKHKPVYKKNIQIKNHHASTTKCRYCQGQHMIYICEKFKALSVTEKNNFIRQSKTCTNCLNHPSKETCHSQSRCNICKQRHHTLLHRDTNNTTRLEKAQTVNSNIGTTTDKTAPPQVETQQKVSSHIAKRSNNVLLATALIRARTFRNDYEYLRALIDPGSQATFITENAAQMLRCPRVKIYSEICGLGETNAGIAHSKINLELIPRFPSKFKLKCEALVLPSLTKTQPECGIDSTEVIRWENVVLADPTFDTPGPIDLILGADIFGEILKDEIKKADGGFLAQKTEFGWILSGPVQQKEKTCRKILSMISRVEIDAQLRKFWEIEEAGSEPVKSEENNICEEHYRKTTTRNADGTYTVHIPFKMAEGLGESKPMAMARLYQLENRFKRNKQLRREYNKFMDEYLQLGHMVAVGPEEGCTKTSGIYYMPHQAVIKEENTTTKLRVVFDASAKTSTKVSLNEMMYNGPRLQEDLQQILLRWRKHRFVFSADIEKMYRQIKITKQDQNFQRILWRFSTEDKIQEYKLTTVTYGTTAAPYLAIKTLQRLAQDEEKGHPEAAKIILRDFYVDDVMSGTYSLQKAKNIQRELIQVLKKGGFNLRKWKSNHMALTESLPLELRDQNSIEIKDEEAVKSLGVYWAPSTDHFHFKVRLNPSSEPPSKRLILSDIARVFDPLGWLAPITVKAKLFIQELWMKGYTWDQPLQPELAEKWTTFRKNLSLIEAIKIPRWMHYSPTCRNYELHGFCDASEKAYGAVIYSKITTDQGKVHITVLTAKTKVAPLKKISLPRLELCGATLLATLMENTKKSLDIEDAKVYAWTDSMITLAWINGRPEKWETFVANRVSRIQEHISPNKWHHVSSKDNPADLASRGIATNTLKDCELWWQGPAWLEMPEEKWPTTNTKVSNPPELIQTLTTNVTSKPTNWEILTRFSSLRKLTRVLAYCNKFIFNCRRKPTERSGELSVKEVQMTLQQVIRLTQQDEFYVEMRLLKAKKPLQSRSPILPLNPFIDNDGILRVGGRIQNALIPYNEKHPIIMPHGHYITKLVINEAHLATLHGGNEATLAYIRRKYFILSGRSKVRQELGRCVKCCKVRGQTVTQMMGALPAARVTPTKPFTHTGVDYAGPIQIRTSKGRGHKSQKGYIAVFVCLSTKAIHIEVVSDMTAEAFIAAFKRFTSRRGLVSHMYSDNGTTFVGAKRTLDQDLQRSIKEINSMASSFASEGIRWHFIPPAAPHFGGIWEAGVKSIKTHLKKIIANSTLTFEELSTLLYQIEACLNSRPLFPISSDPGSVLALTPGHFLIGKELIAPPEPSLEDKIPALKRWQQVQKMTQDFWKVWQREYLSRLQQRTKWQTGAHPIKTGQVVLIKDENCPPAKWPLATIIETHPGEDGVVRVVTVRSKENSIMKRPVTKICLLPTEEDDNTSTKAITQQTHTHIATNPTTPKASEEKSQDTNRTHHPWKGRFLPINSAWSTYLINRKRKSQAGHQAEQQPRSSCSKMARLLLTSMIVLGSINLGNADYTIKYPQPGLYIEHVGQATVKRGTLKIELSTPLNVTAEKRKIDGIVSMMEKACDQSRKFSDNTHCHLLLEHLQERRNSIVQEIEVLENRPKNRAKRGILGSLLQSVFGVNDEVYTDIAHLEQNQDTLRQAAQHQATIMLSAMSQMNDTEIRVTRKIKLITDKLNNVIKEVNKIEGWYEKIDSNQVNIQILAAYQISVDVLEDMKHHYVKLLEATYGKSSLLNFITPSKLKELIEQIGRKIPSNLKIFAEPESRIEVTINETAVTVSGFLHITEVDTYTMIKATAVPKLVDNNTYVAPDIPASIIAIEYNAQKYFELSEEELKQCINIKKHSKLCSPTVVSSIDANPNCVIDEVYHRQEKHECHLARFVTPKVMWKHLYLTNTWLFISNSPVTAAIKCNGRREDVSLHGVGILQITQGCVVQTKKNTLFSENQSRVSVNSTFLKPMTFNITTGASISNQQIEKLELEPILKTSETFSSIAQYASDSQPNSAWKKIGHHAVTATGSGFISIAIVILIWKCRHCFTWPINQKKTMVSAGRGVKVPDFELQVTPNTPRSKPTSRHSTVGGQNVHAVNKNPCHYATVNEHGTKSVRSANAVAPNEVGQMKCASHR